MNFAFAKCAVFLRLRKNAFLRVASTRAAALVFLAAAAHAPRLLADNPTLTTEKSAKEMAREDDARAFVVADAAQEAFVRVAEKLKPSVVSILSQREQADNEMRDFKPPTPRIPTKRADPKTSEKPPAPTLPAEEDYVVQERTTSLGSGMIVRADGYILTSYHVVKGAVSLRVLFDFESERPDRPLARLVGFDEESDLALLKIERGGLIPIEFADSDKVRIGEWAIAIGAPFEQAQSVTIGVISAKGRHLPDKDRISLQDFIQTDASINPGNSGGPLIDLQGRVIGINTSILSPSRYNVGIGFAVPANAIRAVLPALYAGITVSRGFLGVNYTRLDAEAAREIGVEDGVQIGALARDDDGKTIGPASTAGLLAGDVITAINNVRVDSSDTFRRLLAKAAPGDKLALDVTRPEDTSTRKMQIFVTLAPWPGRAKAQGDAASTRKAQNLSPLGLDICDTRDLSSVERTLFPFDTQSRGAVIRDVVPGSPADESQLSRGQMILRARTGGAAWKKIPDKTAFRILENTLAPGARVLLHLQSSSGISTYRVLIVPTATPLAMPAAEPKLN